MSAIAPPSRPQYPSDQEFSKGLRWSVIGHVAFAIAVLLKTTVFPSDPVRITPTLRVDLVGLPDVLKKDLAKTAKAPTSPSPQEELTEALKQAEADAARIKAPKVPAPKAAVEEAEPDEMVLKPKTKAKAKETSKPEPKQSKAALEADRAREKRMRNALARIKSLAKIHAATETKSTGAVVKGNMISKGTSLSGDAKESSVASYYDSVRDQLQANWALPVWLARQNLKAQVRIFLAPNGRLQGMQFVRLSGNPQFDDAVKRTIQASSPFPAPPTELVRTISTGSDGILVGFPL